MAGFVGKQPRLAASLSRYDDVGTGLGEGVGVGVALGDGDGDELREDTGRVGVGPAVGVSDAAAETGAEAAGVPGDLGRGDLDGVTDLDDPADGFR